MERFKELDTRRDNDWHIPVLRKKTHPRLPCLIVYVSMMFQYDVIAEHIPKHLGVLLNDAGVGDDIDDAVKAMRGGVTEGKRHRRKGLPATCRNRKREQTRRQRGGGNAIRAYFLADGVDRGFRHTRRMNFCREIVKISIQSRLQRNKITTCYTFALIGPFSVHETLCRNKIRIDKTRKQHARQEGKRITFVTRRKFLAVKKGSHFLGNCRSVIFKQT